MTKNQKWFGLSLVLLWLFWPKKPTPDTSVTLRIDDPEYPEIDGTVVVNEGENEWPPD